MSPIIRMYRARSAPRLLKNAWSRDSSIAITEIIGKSPTPAQEIYEAVKEYYRARGQEVPAADTTIYLSRDEKSTGEPEPEPEPSKPIYGSIELKAYWGRRNATNS